MPQVAMPATVGSIVFVRRVMQVSFISYFEANIYLFIRMLRLIYSRKYVFLPKTRYFEVVISMYT